MSNTEDIPAVFAVADRYMLSQPTLTEEQRASALQAIALVRELSLSFLDKAEQIIANGAADSTELFTTATTGSRIVSALTMALKALWIMEDAVFKARDAVMGKEGAKNGQ